MLGNWLRQLMKRPHKLKPIDARAKLQVELLEHRTVPAVLNVYSGGSIQTAINQANPGDVVVVHPGTYTGQLTIAKSIEVEASFGCDDDASAIIKAPTNLGTASTANPDAIIHITGAGVHAEIEGLTIKGAATNAGVQNLLYGIRVDGNAFATIEDNRITNIADASNGNLGVAISIGNTAASPDGLGAQVGSAHVYDNIITNYQRGGVIVTNTGSAANIFGNQITGISVHPADSITGVEISDGAVGDVEWNSITNNTNPQNASQDGAGVVLYIPGQGTKIDWNTLSRNDYGVYALSIASSSTQDGQGVSIKHNDITWNSFVGIELNNSSGLNVSDNLIQHNGSDNYEDGGIFLSNSTGNVLDSNQCLNNDGSGIFVDATSTGNTFHDNIAIGNDHRGSIAAGTIAADAVDLTTGSGTADTANTWTDNIGNHSATVSGQSLLTQFGNQGCW